MKPPEQGGWLLEAPDRSDIPNPPTHYGIFNGKPVLGWVSNNGISPHSMIKLAEADWQFVHSGPKWFGLTEKQAREAELESMGF